MIEAMTDWVLTLPTWTRGWAIVAGMTALGLLLHAILYRITKITTRFAPRLSVTQGLLWERSRAPTRLLFPLVAVRVGLGLGAAGGFFTEDSIALLRQVLDALIIGATTWLFVRITYVLEEVISSARTSRSRTTSRPGGSARASCCSVRC
jgi:hypothetical protein